MRPVVRSVWGLGSGLRGKGVKVRQDFLQVALLLHVSMCVRTSMSVCMYVGGYLCMHVCVCMYVCM